MPINAYYKGHGDQVMSSMQKEYGAKRGKSVFYATANKQGLKPKTSMSKSGVRMASPVKLTKSK